MPRRPRQQQPLTDGSWILEGDADVEGSDADSQSAEEDLVQSSKSFVNGSASVSAVEGVSPSSSRYSAASTRRTLAGKKSGRRVQEEPSEPELVMPSMYEDSSTGGRQTASSYSTSRPLKRSRVVDRPERNDSTPRKRQLRADSAPSSEENASFYLHLAWSEVLRPAIGLVLSVLSIIFYVLKPIIAIAFALWIIALLFRYALTSTINRTLAPICALPGSSYLNLPFCNTSSPSGPVEFDSLMTVQSAFEDVLASSAGGASLPLDMKRSEASIRDLKHVVQYSTLPSRNELVFEFGGFIETARQAAGDLSRFNSRIGRAVDHVLSTNRWTLQVLDGVAEQQVSKGIVGHFVENTVMAPFRSPRVTEDLLLQQYIRHTGAVEEQIATLILEAQALLGILQNLDDRLDVIHSITTRDGMKIEGSRDEIFAQLWTKVGGNRSDLKKANAQLLLLNQLSQYRKNAWDHVAGTMIKLQAIAAGLEDLRERVAAPDVLAHRAAEIPLRVHIERIQMGLERLEEQRGENRRVEGAMQRGVLDGQDRLLVD